MRISIGLALSVFVLIAAVITDAGAVEYQIHDLGAFGSSGWKNQSAAFDINDLGQVVGWSYDDNGTRRAFVWSMDTGMAALPRLPEGFDSRALGINNSGQIVGCAGGLDHAVSWEVGGTITELTTFGLGDTGRANSINDYGAAAGCLFAQRSNELHAVVWGPDGGIATDIGSGKCFAINNVGQVAGCDFLDGQPRGFLWSGTTGKKYTDTLYGSEYSEVFDINNLGQVVGESYSHAFVWDLVHSIRELAGFPGYLTGGAYGINDSGQAVGYANIGPYWTSIENMGTPSIIE